MKFICARIFLYVPSLFSVKTIYEKTTRPLNWIHNMWFLKSRNYHMKDKKTHGNKNIHFKVEKQDSDFKQIVIPNGGIKFRVPITKHSKYNVLTFFNGINGCK